MRHYFKAILLTASFLTSICLGAEKPMGDFFPSLTSERTSYFPPSTADQEMSDFETVEKLFANEEGVGGAVSLTPENHLVGLELTESASKKEVTVNLEAVTSIFENGEGLKAVISLILHHNSIRSGAQEAVKLDSQEEILSFLRNNYKVLPSIVADIQIKLNNFTVQLKGLAEISLETVPANAAIKFRERMLSIRNQIMEAQQTSLKAMEVLQLIQQARL